MGIKTRYVKSKSEFTIKGYLPDDEEKVIAGMKAVADRYGFMVEGRCSVGLSYVDSAAPDEDTPLEDTLADLACFSPVRLTVSTTKKGKLQATAMMGTSNLSNGPDIHEALVRAYKAWCRQGRQVDGIDFATALQDATDKLNAKLGD